MQGGTAPHPSPGPFLSRCTWPARFVWSSPTRRSSNRTPMFCPPKGSAGGIDNCLVLRRKDIFGIRYMACAVPGLAIFAVLPRSADSCSHLAREPRFWSTTCHLRTKHKRRFLTAVLKLPVPNWNVAHSGQDAEKSTVRSSFRWKQQTTNNTNWTTALSHHGNSNCGLSN